MIKKTKVIGIFLAILFMMGCATKFFSETGQSLPPGLGYAVQTLEQANNIYDPAMTIVGKMHCDKKITDEQAWKIVRTARVYKLSVDALKISVQEWKNAIREKTDTEPPKYNTYLRLIELSKEVLILAEDYNKITGKNIKIPELLSVDAIKAVFGGQK